MNNYSLLRLSSARTIDLVQFYTVKWPPAEDHETLDFLIISPNKRDEFESSAGVSSQSLEVASLKTHTGDSEDINRHLWV